MKQSNLGAKPPETWRENVKETLHGVEIADPYRWLEDQDSLETRSWIRMQNRYTQSILSQIPGRQEVKRRLTELMRIDVITTPREQNGRYFYYKKRADQELSVLYMREGFHGKERVLLDPHPLSPDHTTSISLLDVTEDGTLIAYGVREGGADEYAIRLLDVDTGRELPDQLPTARYGSVSLKPDKSGFYYSRHTKEGSRIHYHTMGTNPAQDIEIFGTGYTPDKFVSAGLSEDGRYLLLSVSHGWSKSELFVQDVANRGAIIPIAKDIDATFNGQIVGDWLYLRTNWNAPNGRLFVVDLHNPARERWREIIRTSDAVLQGFRAVGGKLFVNYLHNVRSRLQIFDLDGKPLREIKMPTIGSVSGVSGRWASKEVFFSFSSYPVPTTIYRYEVETGKQRVWARLPAPVKSERFEVKQVWYPSKDGTRVPMFLVHDKRIKLDGSNPTLLTGYGGFNSSQTPSFSQLAALWVERGGVYAVPNLRGGGEFGEAWHKAGMLDKKQNSFDDFIAAAEWLIKNNYTNPSKLAIRGGSNGGLLVGAALTQRPDLFQAVICTYPLLDMVRYHKFLVGSLWIPEYGSADNPEQFKTLYAYSPYHRVKQGEKYPAVLFVTGDADTRVAPLHARKMTALLQHATGSGKPVLLLYDTKAGHSGGKPQSKQIEDLTDEIMFLLWRLGMI